MENISLVFEVHLLCLQNLTKRRWLQMDLEYDTLMTSSGTHLNNSCRKSKYTETTSGVMKIPFICSVITSTISTSERQFNLQNRKRHHGDLDKSITEEWNCVEPLLSLFAPQHIIPRICKLHSTINLLQFKVRNEFVVELNKNRQLSDNGKDIGGKILLVKSTHLHLSTTAL